MEPPEYFTSPNRLFRLPMLEFMSPAKERLERFRPPFLKKESREYTSLVGPAFPSAFIYIAPAFHSDSFIDGGERLRSVDAIVLLQILLHPLLLLTLLVLRHHILLHHAADLILRQIFVEFPFPLRRRVCPRRIDLVTPSTHSYRTSIRHVSKSSWTNLREGR